MLKHLRQEWERTIIVQQFPSAVSLSLIFPGPGVLLSFTHTWKKQQKALEAREGTKAAPGSCSPCWLLLTWVTGDNWFIGLLFFITVNKFCTHIMLKWGDQEIQTHRAKSTLFLDHSTALDNLLFPHSIAKCSFTGKPWKAWHGLSPPPVPCCVPTSPTSSLLFLLPPGAIWGWVWHSPNAPSAESGLGTQGAALAKPRFTHPDNGSRDGIFSGRLETGCERGSWQGEGGDVRCSAPFCSRSHGPRSLATSPTVLICISRVLDNEQSKHSEVWAEGLAF